MKVEVKVIPTSSLKIKGRGTFVGQKTGNKQLELVGDQNPGPETPPRSIESERRRNKGEVRGGATAREAMKKNRYDRVIEGKEIRDDPIEYFLPTGARSTF